MSGGRLAALKAVRPLPRGCCRSRASRHSRPAVCRTDAPLDETIEATVADAADNAEVVLEKKHQSEMLRDALTKLSREHREIIDLVYYHEKSAVPPAGLYFSGDLVGCLVGFIAEPNIL